MQLTNEYIRRRNIEQLKKEELEDILYQLQSMEKTLMQKMGLIQRDLEKLEADKKMVASEMEKR